MRLRAEKAGAELKWVSKRSRGSFHLGDEISHLGCGLKRKDPVQAIPLESGDAFVFGGPARLRYHGVSRIIPGTAPPELALSGRFNLTLRQFDAQTADRKVDSE